VTPSKKEAGVRPTFFATPSEFRRWLKKHHATESELLVGFAKIGSGIPSITWPESVDEALCFGWIDGVRKRIDDERYSIRFTPRKRKSTWSAVNIARVAELEKEGRMAEAGRAAFSVRSENKFGTYSYEQRPMDLPPRLQERFRKNPGAWKFYTSQPPSYRKTATWWVIGARKEETTEKRFALLVACSENGERIPMLRRRTGI
jgi:uncharacterized protein YdeI (YjbR/CyaY-like superfamily)